MARSTSRSGRAARRTWLVRRTSPASRLAWPRCRGPTAKTFRIPRPRAACPATGSCTAANSHTTRASTRRRPGPSWTLSSTGRYRTHAHLPIRAGPLARAPMPERRAPTSRAVAWTIASSLRLVTCSACSGPPRWDGTARGASSARTLWARSTRRRTSPSGACLPTPASRLSSAQTGRSSRTGAQPRRTGPSASPSPGRATTSTSTCTRARSRPRASPGSPGPAGAARSTHRPTGADLLARDEDGRVSAPPEWMQTRHALLLELAALPGGGDVLEWQRRLADAIIEAEDPPIGTDRAVAKRHRHLLRVIADGLVHTLLPEHTVRSLSRHPGKPASLSAQGADFDFVFEQATRLSSLGFIPIIADLTTLIGIGDIVGWSSDGVVVLECKNRPAPAQGAPTGRLAGSCTPARP